MSELLTLRQGQVNQGVCPHPRQGQSRAPRAADVREFQRLLNKIRLVRGQRPVRVLGTPRNATRRLKGRPGKLRAPTKNQTLPTGVCRPRDQSLLCTALAAFTSPAPVNRFWFALGNAITVPLALVPLLSVTVTVVPRKRSGSSCVEPSIG